MKKRIAALLDALAQDPKARKLLRFQRGIEKEALRIDPNGLLAQTAHPKTLGSPLTHASITTDYSEALLEFITPVSDSTEQTLQQLHDIHRYVYDQLGDELLWTASMPCALTADSDIPVAQYGSSNSARLKTVYRYGLGHRYGRRMQTIAGIHYNFSLPESFWPWLQSYTQNTQDVNDFRTERYLGLIRNFQRWSWLLVYLFGASPAVCSTFLKGRKDHGLEPTDAEHNSYHLPYATSLRMGGLGYNSDTQKSLQVCYNQLDTYVDTLRAAIVEPHPAYSDIPKILDGEYQQLSDCLLQIENEFYSPIRPKRVSRSGEPSLHALALGGIEYIEVRCIDLNPFLPTGIDAPQIRFLDLFLLYCLLKDSPQCTFEEQTRLADNFSRVVTRGREPGLELNTPSERVSLKDWGLNIMTELEDFAATLDSLIEPGYSEALRIQRQKLLDPELTPSAQVSQRVQQGSFFSAALNQARSIKTEFLTQPLEESIRQRFETEAAQSLKEQAAIEAADEISFEEFLQRFLDQYRLESLHPKQRD